MRTLNRTARQGRRALAPALLLGAALTIAVAARAEVEPFEVVVPLKGTTAEDRAAALSEALRAVAVKASGRREAAGSPAVNGANPAKYVQRYSTTAERMLKVGFDAPATERLLQQAGLPLWPAERPVTVIAAPVPNAAALEAAAAARGLPIEWGAAPATFSAALAVLVGVPSGGQFDWRFTHQGRTVEARGTVQDGIDLAADTLAARYAPASTRSTNELTLRVGGMEDLPDYAGLLAYLRELSLVRRVEVESLDAAVVTLRLSVRGDRELLARIAALDGRLQPATTGEGGAPAALDFVYQR